MIATHYEIQIWGWSSHKFFSSCQGKMFFYPGGCPVGSLCDACQDRIDLLKEHFVHFSIEFEELVTPSGHHCFKFDGPIGGSIYRTDPIDFMQIFLASFTFDVLRKWQSEVRTMNEVVSDF